MLLVVAFVFAPLSVAISGSGEWTPLAGLDYVWHNLGMRITQMGIDGTLESAAYPVAWNGSLWTLWYEFLCYLVLGVLVSFVPVRWLGVTAVAMTALCAVGVVAIVAAGTPSLALLNAVTLGGYFAAGVILYSYRDRVPLSAWLAALSAVLIVVTAATSTFRIVAGLPVAYLMMWLGVVLPLSPVGAKNDISYGMYVYAFPVQQLLAILLVGAALPAGVFVLIAIAATVPFAYASWVLVEKPAMRLKSFRLRWPRRREAARPPEAI